MAGDSVGIIHTIMADITAEDTLIMPDGVDIMAEDTLITAVGMAAEQDPMPILPKADGMR